MLLFFSPVLNLLSESRKQSRLVFWGVELIPTPDANKSLQVSGDFHAQLLSYIKHYIDEAIAEMEASEAAPQTEEIADPYSSETEIARLNEAVDKKATQSEPKTNSSSSEKIETDGVESVKTEPTPQKPEIVKTEAVEVIKVSETEDTEVVETDETEEVVEAVEVGETEEVVETDELENWPVSDDVEPTPNNSKEVTTDEAIATLLECQTKLQLMSKKKDIGEELVQKAWDEMTLVQKNYLQLISLRENVTKPMGTLGYQLLYQPTKDSKPRKARLIGFYLHGDKLPQADEQSILVDGETQPTVCSKAHLRPFKNSAKATEQKIKLLEKLLTEPQETEPTAETMSANTFTGLATAPKPQTGIEIGSQLDSEPSKPSVAETIINHLKQIDNKLDFQTEGDIINVNLDEQEIGYIDCEDFSVATILDEKLHKDYFFDICSYLGDVEAGEVEQVEDYYIVGHAPKQPESTVSEPSDEVQAGDIIEVHTASALSGKTVEVNYVKPDGTVNVVWDNKNYDVPASDYKIFSKGLGIKKI